MIYNSTNKIAHQQAKNILETGSPLRDFTVNGSIEIDAGSEWKKDVLIEHCIIENFKCLMVYLKKSDY